MTSSINIGGLVAIGFDKTGRFMLCVSHAGRGVFELGTWDRVARDGDLAYPEDGIALGIGPIAGQQIPVREIDYATGTLVITTPDGTYRLAYQSGIIAITPISI